MKNAFLAKNKEATSKKQPSILKMSIIKSKIS